MITDDTIVAISTAAGSSPRAIVRLSGPEAVNIAGAIFRPPSERLEELAGFSTVEGLVGLGRGIELPARLYLFRAPRSYTRQDVVELHIPGPAPAATATAAALLDAGARQAEGGEFTARAFFTGRIDLSAAEAVADIVNAEDSAQLRVATAAAGGEVHRLCKQAAGELTEVLAIVEVSIDMATEDIQIARPAALADQLDGLATRLESVAEDAAAIPETAHLPRVVMAGKANVGKSSLLNAMTGTDRAIVSAMAGTTRDVLSAPLELPGGGSVILQDAAGFGCDEGNDKAGSPLAAATHQAAISAVARAEMILFVTDATAGELDPDMRLLQLARTANPQAGVLALVNKVDLLESNTVDKRISQLSRQTNLQAVGTSAVTHVGLRQVRQLLGEFLQLKAVRAGGALGLHERQKRCLLAAARSAAQGRELLTGAAEVADIAELAAVELRDALAQLGRISGEIVTEDVLGAIFARFCIGK